ncbi:MAG: DNA polymerase III subunit [Mariprofundaceae bacterium]|nr:DNA polymerase III subunit [Mariprofundaceae bacterium]
MSPSALESLVQGQAAGQAQVLGHDAVRHRFTDTLGRKRLHHAWLLHGPGGIGKRMMARALAADYLCEVNQGNPSSSREACGACHACRMMAAGSHPDFMLLEREWNPKTKRINRDVNIEQVRRMLGFLSLSGQESARRVALIGDAGRLNGQAANAMLKGLEEPSQGSLLLLVCEDALALPATVRSRCLLQAMSTLNADDVRDILQAMPIADHSLDFAVQLADGRPGKVAALADAAVADALLDWHTLLARPASLDIGKAQQWISRHVQQVPHELIAAVALSAAEPLLCRAGDTQRMDAVFDALRQLAAWPQDVIRRTLRPAPTLLAHMLALRIALRALAQAV